MKKVRCNNCGQLHKVEDWVDGVDDCMSFSQTPIDTTLTAPTYSVWIKIDSPKEQK